MTTKKKCRERRARELTRKQREADRRKRDRQRDDLRTRLRLTIRDEHDERDAFALLVDRMPLLILERLVAGREVGLAVRLLKERIESATMIPIEVEVQIPEADRG